MSRTVAPADPSSSRPRPPRFGRHLLEMVLAMVLGMLVLGGALRAVLAGAGVRYSMEEYPTLVVLEMALTMTVGMAVWMTVRGHRWPEILEMGAAMVVPAIVVIPPIRSGALDAGTAMVIEHVGMVLAMVVVMLRHRGPGATRRDPAGPRGRWAPVALGLVALLALLGVPGLVLAGNSAGFAEYRYAPPGPTAARAAATVVPRPHDPSRPTAVVAVGNHGANVADTLVPYEILAGTGAFNVYTVAPDRRPVPLLGGLDLVPDLSIAELERRLAGAPPAVTVVPEMPDTDPGTDLDDSPVTGWLRERAGRGLVLGVCTGARLLAEAGLLDGRPATSHWYRTADLEDDHPQVIWRRGVRYVDDGAVVTTGGLLSSVDGTLRIVERLLGPGAAGESARRVGWRHYTPGTAAPLPPSGLTPTRALTHVLNLGFRSGSTTVGIPLTDGVGELDLAAAFGPYAEVKAARTLAVGDRAVRSRHGLTFVPRGTPQAVEGLDLLLIPAGVGSTELGPVLDAAYRAGTPGEQLDASAGFVAESALRVMARTMDETTAGWAAVVLEYQPDDLRAGGPGWPWGPTLAALALGLGGVLATGGAAVLVRRVRPRATAAQTAPAAPPETGAHPGVAGDRPGPD